VLLKHNYFYFKKAVSIKTCEKIIKAGRKKIIKPTSIIGEMDKVIRDCKYAWLQHQWIYDIINPFIHIANEKAGWNFQWDWNESSQFTIYEKGHYYGWHMDQYLPKKNKDKNLDGKIRKLSLTLQLTDRTEYDGGDFQCRWIDHRKKNLLDTVTIDDAKDIGTIIIFPSFIHHQVLPITRGKRESLVNWSVGKLFT